jgi:hypothetical protein
MRTLTGLASYPSCGICDNVGELFLLIDMRAEHFLPYHGLLCGTCNRAQRYSLKYLSVHLMWRNFAGGISIEYFKIYTMLLKMPRNDSPSFKER